MLFIRYESVQALREQDPLVTWAWQDQQVFHPAQQATLLSQLIGQLPAALKSILLHRVAIILPSEAVSLYQVDLPHIQKKHLLKAIPYALEEKLAEDVDQLHFSILSSERDKPVQVAVISASLLQQNLAQLKQYHIYPLYMTSELTLLPAHAQIFIEKTKVFMRLNKEAMSDSVMTAMTEQLPALLHQWLSPEEAAEQMAAAQPLVLQDLCAQYANQITDRSLLNILQGNFRQKTQRNMSARKMPWRSVAALFAVILLMKACLCMGEIIYYGHQASLLEAQSLALYKSYFPQTKQIHNVKRELKAKLRAANLNNNQAGFLALLSQASKPLTDVAQQSASRFTVEHLSYDQTKGLLRMDFSISDFPALDNFKRALEQAGLTVIIDAANQDKDSVKARIQLRLI